MGELLRPYTPKGMLEGYDLKKLDGHLSALYALRAYQQKSKNKGYELY